MKASATSQENIMKSFNYSCIKKLRESVTVPITDYF